MSRVLSNEHDGADSVRLRASQNNRRSCTSLSHVGQAVPGGELLSRAALAAVLGAQEFASDPVWAGAFAEWGGLVGSQGVPAGPADRA